MKICRWLAGFVIALSLLTGIFPVTAQAQTPPAVEPQDMRQESLNVSGGHNVMGANAPNTTWYFAEGYTGPGFDEFLTILNPNDTAAQVRITYYLKTGSPVIKVLSVMATSRYTVAVHDTFQGVGRNQEVSAKVETTNGVGIVVERPMYFTYSGSMGIVTGGHNVKGVNAPAEKWYFAEGYTGAGFDQFLTILNPNSSQANVTITYFLSSGETVIKSLMIGSMTRYTVGVHDTFQGVGRGKEVSAKVETTNGIGIVVERPMYFKYNGSVPVDEGHIVMGANAPDTTWYFAEGYTSPGFDEYLTILNPESRDAEVAITYYVTIYGVVTKSFIVKANSRYTVAVHDTFQGVGRGKEVSAKVETTNGVGIIVERPMYFRYNGSMGNNVKGSHNVKGVPKPSAMWYFAEGYTGAGFDEYLAILNPSSSQANVEVTYFLSSGETVIKTFVVEPMTRYTVLVHSTFKGVGRNQEVATRVEVTNGVGIIVERPMYFNIVPPAPPPSPAGYSLSVPKVMLLGVNYLVVVRLANGSRHTVEYSSNCNLVWYTGDKDGNAPGITTMKTVVGGHYSYPGPCIVYVRITRMSDGLVVNLSAPTVVK